MEPNKNPVIVAAEADNFAAEEQRIKEELTEISADELASCKRACQLFEAGLLAAKPLWARPEKVFADIEELREWFEPLQKPHYEAIYSGFAIRDDEASEREQCHIWNAKPGDDANQRALSVMESFAKAVTLNITRLGMMCRIVPRPIDDMFSEFHSAMMQLFDENIRSTKEYEAWVDAEITRRSTH